MRFQGTVTIRAARQKIWDFMTNAEAVASCAPGLESLEVQEPCKRFRAVGTVALGSVKQRFSTSVEWTDLEKPRRASMKFCGTAPGSAVNGKTSMTLSDGAGGATELTWEADLAVVGTLAAVAARLMDGVVRKLTAEFFERLQKKIESRKDARGRR
ncbi:MAG TPA: carbon monoxide dehydrogenase subunit G [Thermoanaerobaculia bacterium]|nr:carbon monoxide dehydrogenase subunit G [Thermoanaerobaculia bacterium]